MQSEGDVSTVIEVENTTEGKEEMVRQLEALLDNVRDNTDAADEKSRLRLRIFTKKC
jgi:hypothetical protein